MESLTALLSNSQFWTIAMSGIAGLGGALGPILVARYAAKEAAAKAKLELAAAAEKAACELKTSARRDALDEVWKIAAEREKQVAELRAKDADQQHQIDTLKDQHRDCEDRHAALEWKVEKLSGTVTKIANGGLDVKA